MIQSGLRLKAQELRQQGFGIKEIARMLNVPKSTVSGWVKSINLTVEQVESLKQRSIKGSELGRLKGALIQKQKRLNLIEEFQQKGQVELSVLSEGELLVAGLALYWGEGGKTNRRVELCNSDPKMIKFFISWLCKCFKVKKDELMCCIGINQGHIKREFEVRSYWSNVTGVPLDQFRKTSFKKVTNKKVYQNFDQHFGTLSIRVAKSSLLYYKISGLINALGMAG